MRQNRILYSLQHLGQCHAVHRPRAVHQSTVTVVNSKLCCRQCVNCSKQHRAVRGHGWEGKHQGRRGWQGWAIRSWEVEPNERAQVLDAVNGYGADLLRYLRLGHSLLLLDDQCPVRIVPGGQCGRCRLWRLVCISVALFIFPDQVRPLGFVVELVKNERLRRSVARTLCTSPYTGIAFRLCFIATDFTL